MPILERISLPSKGKGHESIRRKEWEKAKPLKEQVKDGVWMGLENQPCILTMQEGQE